MSDRLNELGRTLSEMMGKDGGFLLVTVKNEGEGSAVSFISDIKREQLADLLEEMRERVLAGQGEAVSGGRAH